MARPWKIPDLQPDEPLRGNLLKIAQGRFQETFSYEEAIVEYADIEALHDMRVAARRLQAVLLIFQDCFPKKKLRKHRDNIQRLIKNLGRVREADVFLEMLQTHETISTNGGSVFSAEDSVALDLLIAQEMHERVLARRELLRELRRLHAMEYETLFEKFLHESL